MQVSVVSICCMALAHLGQRKIMDITERSDAANVCLQHYDTARLQVLSETLWGFASSWATGVQLNIAPKPGWQYCFTYPTDALRVFEIWNANSSIDDDRIPFEITDNPNVNATGKLIQANIANPVFVYTRDKEDVSTFDQDFIQALSWLLAEKICMQLTKNAKLTQTCMQQYEMMKSKAKARTKNEGQADNTDRLSFHHKVR